MLGIEQRRSAAGLPSIMDALPLPEDSSMKADLTNLFVPSRASVVKILSAAIYGDKHKLVPAAPLPCVPANRPLLHSFFHPEAVQPGKGVSRKKKSPGAFKEQSRVECAQLNQQRLARMKAEGAFVRFFFEEHSERVDPALLLITTLRFDRDGISGTQDVPCVIIVTDRGVVFQQQLSRCPKDVATRTVLSGFVVRGLKRDSGGGGGGGEGGGVGGGGGVSDADDAFGFSLHESVPGGDGMFESWFVATDLLTLERAMFASGGVGSRKVPFDQRFSMLQRFVKEVIPASISPLKGINIMVMPTVPAFQKETMETIAFESKRLKTRLGIQVAGLDIVDAKGSPMMPHNFGGVGDADPVSVYRWRRWEVVRLMYERMKSGDAWCYMNGQQVSQLSHSQFRIEPMPRDRPPRVSDVVAFALTLYADKNVLQHVREGKASAQSINPVVTLTPLFVCEPVSIEPRLGSHGGETTNRCDTAAQIHEAQHRFSQGVSSKFLADWLSS
jgi:hypothetical protein